MKKKLNIMHFSPTGATRKIVKKIAGELSKEVVEFEITFPSNRQKNIVFSENDLLIIGVPVYGGRVPEFIVEYCSKIKGNNTMAVFVVVYGNRDYEDALIELKQTLEKNSFIGIGAGAFIGEHSYTEKLATNRPDAKDLKIAQEFGVEIKNKLSRIAATNEITDLFVKGNLPYKERSAPFIATPDTDDKCIFCAACAENCPTGAISFDDFSLIDASLCIHCFGCVKICPVDAKSFNNETIDNIIEKLELNFSEVRKEPELFL